MAGPVGGWNPADLGVVIPTVGANTLADTLLSLPAGVRLYLRDNRQENWGVAKSWNWGVRQALTDGCRWVLVLNDDVRLLAPTVPQRLVEALALPDVILTTAVWDRSVPDSPWDHPQFGAFCCDGRLLAEIGPFDEQFWPAYFEDCDMHERIKRSGRWRTYSPLDAQYATDMSQSIRQLPHIARLNQEHFPKNRAYFIQKWGYSPV